MLHDTALHRCFACLVIAVAWAPIWAAEASFSGGQAVTFAGVRTAMMPGDHLFLRSEGVRVAGSVGNTPMSFQPVLTRLAIGGDGDVVIVLPDPVTPSVLRVSVGDGRTAMPVPAAGLVTPGGMQIALQGRLSVSMPDGTVVAILPSPMGMQVMVQCPVMPVDASGILVGLRQVLPASAVAIPLRWRPLIRAAVDHHVEPGGTLELSLSALTVHDPDSAFPAAFTLSVLAGSDYAVNGGSLTVARGFLGILPVAVTVNDGGLTSEVFIVAVDVSDRIAPAMVLLGEAHVVVECGDTFSDPGATAVDAVDGDLSGSITVGPSVDTSRCATTICTYSATDRAGNVASLSRTVVVVDTTAPVVALLGAAVVELDAGTSFVDPGATAVDRCDGDISAAIVVTGSVATAVAGTYPITYSVTDAAGHTGSVQRRVVVRVAAPPTVSCGVAIVSLWPPNHRMCDVGLSVTAAAPAGLTDLSLDVSQNEPVSGPGDSDPDAVIVVDAAGAPGALFLRAERSSSGGGRVYLVLATATDRVGRTAQAQQVVVVPRNLPEHVLVVYTQSTDNRVTRFLRQVMPILRAVDAARARTTPLAHDATVMSSSG
ncbi:MAG: DUF5011 domain-containing protein [Planctomycetes bacterium]|nr:DUF5011 domain-containing protein [Planctomycetota bacterium]